MAGVPLYEMVLGEFRDLKRGWESFFGEAKPGGGRSHFRTGENPSAGSRTCRNGFKAGPRTLTMNGVRKGFLTRKREGYIVQMGSSIAVLRGYSL